MPANRINNNELNHQRPYQRNTARRSTPLPANLDLVKSKIENAIRNRNEELEEPIEEDWPLHPANIIGQAKRNMSIYQNQYNVHQHATNFMIGYALDNIEGTEDWEGISINREDIRIAERTYRMFRNWPNAIQHLGNLSPRQWRGLHQEDDEIIYQEMISKYLEPLGSEPDGFEPLGSEQDLEPLGSEPVGFEPVGLEQNLEPVGSELTAAEIRAINELLLSTYPIIFN